MVSDSFVATYPFLPPFTASPVTGPVQNFTVEPSVSPVAHCLPSLVVMQREGREDSENSTKLANASEDKAALSFILSSSDTESEPDETNPKKRRATTGGAAAKRRRSLTSTSVATTANSVPARKGSKFCSVEGCTSRAKHAKRCWKHGGWVRCKVPDCNNRAKSKGVCWSHGGGTVCSFENCDTISVSNGFCWAHGGGKRCQVPNCSKPAYERTQNYCQAHFEERGRGSS